MNNYGHYCPPFYRLCYENHTKEIVAESGRLLHIPDWNDIEKKQNQLIKIRKDKWIIKEEINAIVGTQSRNELGFDKEKRKFYDKYWGCAL